MAARFANSLKELRIHLCQTGPHSAGVRDFITKYYVDMKKANPKFPILIRECSGVQPKVWARYGEYDKLIIQRGKEASASLTNKSAEEVLEQVKSLASKTY